MRTSLILELSGGLAVAISIWHWRHPLAEWLDDTLLRSRFYEVLKTFCAEAAVLWLVFPVLDIWEKPEVKSWLLLYTAPPIVAIFLLLAALAAKKEEEEKERGN